MLKWSRAFLVWSCFVAVLAIAVWGATYSPSYQKCTEDNKHYYREAKQSEFNKPISRRAHVPLFLLCEGKFIDENAVSLTLLATIAVAAFTLTLWRATTEHGRISDSVLKLARDEFNAAHRPRLKIRNVRLSGIHTRVLNIPLMDGQEITCKITVANIGDQATTIIKWQYRIHFRKDVLSQSDVFFEEPKIIDVPVLLRIGEAKTIELSDKLVIYGEHGALYRITFENGDRKLIVVGNVMYADAANCQRTIGFCRELQSSGRFAVVDDHDYEYED